MLQFKPQFDFVRHSILNARTNQAPSWPSTFRRLPVQGKTIIDRWKDGHADRRKTLRHDGVCAGIPLRERIRSEGNASESAEE